MLCSKQFFFDDNYFFDKYQGVPIDGYTKLIENMTEGIDIILNENYFHKLNNIFIISIAFKFKAYKLHFSTVF